MRSTLLAVWTDFIIRGVLRISYLNNDEAQRCLRMLSTQLLLVVFDLAYDSSSEYSQ